MMTAQATPMTVRILDRDYQVACEEDEREALIAAADYVDRRMQEVRARGNVIGTDRVAVMAALNIAHDLLSLQESERALQRVNEGVGDLQQRVAAKLSESA